MITNTVALESRDALRPPRPKKLYETRPLPRTSWSRMFNVRFFFRTNSKREWMPYTLLHPVLILCYATGT